MEKLRIFAASASDMASERAKVENVAEALKPLADSLDIVIDVVDWGAVVPDMGRPEQVILDQLQPTSWDVFVGMVWHRFGTPPAGRDPATGRDYLSGTEEEFKTAHRLWQQYGRPRIMMYRCTRPIPPDALDPDQFKAVKEFFAGFEAAKGEHPGLYGSFDTAQAFERTLLKDLQRLLLDYGEQLRGEPIRPDMVQAFAPKIPNNLPRRAAFFGRETEMDKVLGTLGPEERGWGVVIDGIGGIGKTALAVEAAHRAQERGMFDAFIFVSAKEKYLAPGGIREQAPAARTLDEFINETARVLGQTGIAQLTGKEKRRALLEALRETRALLIYDNLETLGKEEQEALADFLRFLPGNSKAALTSRRRGGEGALWLRLEMLAWDAARQIMEDEARKDEGLKAKLARAQGRWRKLYDETRGSPLALVNVLGLMRARATLDFDGALELLRGGRDTDLQRFIFEEARKELGESEVAALGALSFFVPSAPFEALMEVAELSRNALEMTLDRLDALSLLDRVEGAERYALHPLTRNFARDELLADAQTATETGWRFARHWVAYAERYGGASRNYKTFDRVEAEWANLDAAAAWLWETAGMPASPERSAEGGVEGDARGGEVADQGAARQLNDLARALRSFFWFSGRWDERVQLSTQAYQAVRALNDWSDAGWRANDVAWIYSIYARNLPNKASVWADRCAEAWARGGSKHEQATGIRTRGLVADQRGDYEAAERLYQDALAVWRDLKDDQSTPLVLNDLGELSRRRKNYDAAEEYYREALEIYEKEGDKQDMAAVLGNLGLLALDRNRLAEAREWCEKALNLAQQIGRQDVVASNKFRLARVHEDEGQPDLALPLAEEALAIRERLRDQDLALTQELVERLREKVG